MLKDRNIRKRFEGKVIKLIDIGDPKMCGHVNGKILKECDEVCGKKRVEEAKEKYGAEKKR